MVEDRTVSIILTLLITWFDILLILFLRFIKLFWNKKRQKKKKIPKIEIVMDLACTKSCIPEEEETVQG